MTSPLVLVTGAPGWLGSRLVESLIKGLPDVPSLAPLGQRKVRCLVRPGTDVTALTAISPLVEVVWGDLTDTQSLEVFVSEAHGATLFHSAAVIHPSSGTSEFTKVNVEGTRQLADAAAKAQVRRFVYVSSNSPIGTNPSPDHVFDESAPYNPYMGYGKSKVKAEGIINAARESGAFETVIVRPPWFYGPGQPARQALFFTMVKEGKVPIVGGGENKRSMGYVDNLCQGLLLAERVAQANGGTYWIADRRPYTMNEIVDTIEQVLEEQGMKVAHKRVRLPGFVSEIAWVVDATLQSVGLYHQKMHVLSEMNKTIACSISKAEAELGYAPKVELREGMRRSIQWALANGQTI